MTLPALAILGTLVLGAPSVSSAPSAQFRPTALRVAAQGADEYYAHGGIVRGRLGETVRLFAVLEGRSGTDGVVVAATDRLLLDNKPIAQRAIVSPASLSAAQLRWYKVEPVGTTYDNTANGFHWDKIDYGEFAVGNFGSSWDITADAHPVGGYPDTHGGAGTMAYKVELVLDGATWASPGARDIERGGLSDRVTRVALRRDDTYVGYLTELFNTPYIWGSAGEPDSMHQAERLIGSDCADFIVYGARRMGKKIPYTDTFHLPKYANVVARVRGVDSSGRYLDEHGQLVPVGQKGVQIGDLLLFPRHVGALVADNAPLGFLSIRDRMIHTLFAPPTEESIMDTSYAKSEFDVLRWK
jgi:hypothetical protein